MLNWNDKMIGIEKKHRIQPNVLSASSTIHNNKSQQEQQIQTMTTTSLRSMFKIPFIIGGIALIGIIMNLISLSLPKNSSLLLSSTAGTSARSTRTSSNQYFDSSYQEEEDMDRKEYSRHVVDDSDDNDDNAVNDSNNPVDIKEVANPAAADVTTFLSLVHDQLLKEKEQNDQQEDDDEPEEQDEDEDDDDDDEDDELDQEEEELNIERNIKSDIIIDLTKIKKINTKDNDDKKKKEKDEDSSDDSSDDKKKQKKKSIITIKKSKDKKTKKEKVYYNALDPNNKHEKVGKKKYPSLNKLITDNTTGIINDVSFLLDFAILGHAKTATSYLMNWLHGHDQIHIWDYEVCDLYDHKPALLINKLYNDFHIPNINPKDGTIATNYYKRGFKCPGHFSRPSLRYFHDVFPNTVLVIGLRHPVKWFESYYNFRFRHMRWDNVSVLPDPNLLMSPDVEECPPAAQGVCTIYAKFHQNLAKFGKTNWRSIEENKLLNLDVRIQSMRTIHNPIFLYDMAQFYDTDMIRKKQLKLDLQYYLNLTKPLNNDYEHHVSTRPKYKAINICDSHFDDVRKQLISIGKRASIWIRKYFIILPEVYTSSTDYFEQILQTWKYDPCTVNVTAML